MNILQMEHGKSGPKPNPRREAYIKRYKITRKIPTRFLTVEFMDQLDMCRSEAARRILLGVSK
jgi:hypothetical protein